MMSIRSNELLRLAAPLLVTAFLGACGGEKTAKEPAAVVDLKTEIVRSMSLPVVHPAVATIRARTTSPVTARLLGNVVAVHVKEGDQVRKGELLLELDGREVSAGLVKASAGIEEIDRAIGASEAALQAAEANRRLATSTYERFQALKERRSVSPQEFDEVEARYRAANADAARASETLRSLRAKRRQVEADVSNANTFISYARITSPIDGIVASKTAEVGLQAAPGMPLLVVEDNRTFEADAMVEESMSARIRAGDSVPVHIEAIGATLIGTVARVVPALDASTRTSTVKIGLPADPRLRSGLFAEARFPVGERKAIAVPNRAVLRRGQLDSVFVADSEGVVRLRLVKTGRTVEDRIEILSGLDDGERLVLDAAAAKEGVKIGEGA